MKEKFVHFLAGLTCLLVLACNGTIVPETGDNPDNNVENPDDVPGGGDDADVDKNPVDLSASGTANCYVITSGGQYSFNARVKGNGAATDGLGTPEALSPVSAELLWQDRKSMITDVTLLDGNVVFIADDAPGNAVIAVENANGEIIWSWHLWHPESEIREISTSTGYGIMNMNLGAMSTELGLSAYGLLYQWGRKDPFPGSPVPSGGTVSTTNAPVYDIDGKEVKITASSMSTSTSNTLAYSIAHPTTCLSNGATGNGDWLTAGESSPALWGNPEGGVTVDGKYVNRGSKSVYDPCPPNWMVPPAELYSTFTASGQYAWVNLGSDGNPTTDGAGNMSVTNYYGEDSFNVCDLNGDGIITMEDYSNGWVFVLGPAESSYFPAATRYDGTYAMLMGSMVGLWGNYWTNASASNSDFALAMAFSVADMYGRTQITVSPSANGGKANAFSVRCVRIQ